MTPRTQGNRTDRRPGMPYLGAIVCLLGMLLPAGTARAQQTQGELRTVGGIRVLVLTGTASEQGYAHGYMMADEILRMFENCVLDPRILSDPAQYEKGVRGQLLPRMTFRPEYVDELAGIRAGMRAKLGESGLMLARLGRSLDIDDLKAINTVADWYGTKCSSFSAWGALAGTGGMITARNLDFIDIPGLREANLVIVHATPARDGAQRWVSVAWPGIIGAYTAMNESGVTISMHDAPGRKPGGTTPFTPRSFALREVIETANADDYIATTRRIFQSCHVMRGNNIHVSGPWSGQQIPAAVFEYDGDTATGDGLTMRTPEQDRTAVDGGTIQCTNHYRDRGAPTACRRYQTMTQRLAELAAAHKPVDVQTARSIMKDVSVPSTLHTVIFLPNEQRMFVGLADALHNGAENQPVELTLHSLLTK